MALLLALLLASAPARAWECDGVPKAAPGAQLCRFSVFKRAGKRIIPELTQRFPKDSELCREAERLSGVVDRLSRAAWAEAKLSELVSCESYPYAASGGSWVVASSELLRRGHAAQDFAAAHEVAHIYSYVYEKGALTVPRKARESRADAFGAELLGRIGLPVSTAAEGWASVVGCAQMALGFLDISFVHPDPALRWDNLKREQDALQARAVARAKSMHRAMEHDLSLTPADLDPVVPHEPAFGHDAFDGRGKLKGDDPGPSGLLPYCRAGR